MLFAIFRLHFATKWEASLNCCLSLFLSFFIHSSMHTTTGTLFSVTIYPRFACRVSCFSRAERSGFLAPFVKEYENRRGRRAERERERGREEKSKSKGEWGKNICMWGYGASWGQVAFECAYSVHYLDASRLRELSSRFSCVLESVLHTHTHHTTPHTHIQRERERERVRRRHSYTHTDRSCLFFSEPRQCPELSGWSNTFHQPWAKGHTRHERIQAAGKRWLQHTAAAAAAECYIERNIHTLTRATMHQQSEPQRLKITHSIYNCTSVVPVY